MIPDHIRNFRSDNNSGLCREAIDALVATASEYTTGYGADPHTAEATALLRHLFGEQASVFFVATGTAANVLALASVTEPWQRILCHAHAHLAVDESTAPETITRCRVTPVETEQHRSKLTPADIRRHHTAGNVHNPQPGAISITTPTEFGEVYTPGEIRALADEAHALGYRVHLDGARLANAVAHLGCKPREITVDAGVDALSFGGTKNGLGMGEAVLLFPQGDGCAAASGAARFPFLRKASGHLVSKARFITAPFAAVLKDGAWLRYGGHANAMANRLAAALPSGLNPAFPVESNGVFVPLSKELHERLVAEGYEYYLQGPREWRCARFMMSFDTSPEKVDALIEALAR